MWCGRCASGIAQPTDGAKITVPRAVAALRLNAASGSVRATAPRPDHFSAIARLVLAVDAQVLVVAEQLERRHLPVVHEAVPREADVETCRAHAPVVVVVLEHAGAEALVERPDDTPDPGAASRRRRTRASRSRSDARARFRNAHPPMSGMPASFVVAHRDLRLVADRVRHRPDEAEVRMPRADARPASAAMHRGRPCRC